MTTDLQNPLTPEYQWKKKYPTIISGIFSAIQILITIAIIGLEIGSILIDAIVATVYVGIWSGVFFLFASISQAIAACCRNRNCATYTVVIQTICVFFSICVIAFDAYYIAYPTTCFFPSSTCGMSGSYRGLFYSDANFNNLKMSFIKAQLAAGAVMLLLCLLYITIYIITVVRIYRTKQRRAIHPQTEKPYPLSCPPTNGFVPPALMNNYGLPNVITPGDNRNTLLVCPSCSTAMNMTVNKKL